MLDKDLMRLLDQESFLNYCFGRNDNDVGYWKKWLEANPEQAIHIEELKRTVIMMAKASQVTLRDKHFDELQQRIAGQSATIISIKKRSFWRPAVAAAAVVTLVTGAALFYYQAKKPAANNPIVKRNEIKPGGNKAILTLANGRKISLTDASNGQIAVQANVRITKTATGQIIYELPGGDSTEKSVYNTIEAPAGGQWQVVLPDRSKVWLNARSSLSYPTSFTGNERKVRLKGEAYFEIAHNANMPFRVISKEQTVEVLGTHFDIMAYDDEAIMKTTLLEGAVKITNGSRSRILAPGEQAQVSDELMKVTNDADLEDVIAWKNGYFKFNENVGSIMRKVARWYDVEIIYGNNADPSLHFGGKISRYKNLSSALKIMELTGNIHFKVAGRRVTVMR
jgi:transmembrane sensor